MNAVIMHLKENKFLKSFSFWQERITFTMRRTIMYLLLVYTITAKVEVTLTLITIVTFFSH